jgi:sulfotransferase
MFGFDPRLTVYERYGLWRDWNGLVGVGLNGLKQAFYGDQANRLLLLRYETVVKDPGYAMGRVYDFLDIEPFAHDYANLAQSSDSTDFMLGTPGLHTVRNVLQYDERRTVLPKDIWMRAAADTFWEGENPRKVLIV